ncbi:hypothetical protein H8D64_00540, partial [PVC group bacterium]|nr:hypothetical protein [PVC group bacterium]
MKFRCFIFLFIAGFCCFTYTRAGTIDLNFQPATTFRNGKAGISAKITNRGTIPAQHIQLEAILAGDSAFNQQHSLLESKETFSTTIELGTPPEPDGIYTIVIKTRYSDPNGYPLSTLKTVPLVTDMPLFAEPPIKATLKASDLLRKNGKLILKIKSHYDMALEVNASLFTTDEL